MRRVVWVAVGAAGGILVYRRAQQALLEARERGLLANAQQVGRTAVSAVHAARGLAALVPGSAGPGAGESKAGAATVLAVVRGNSRKESDRGLRRDP